VDLQPLAKGVALPVIECGHPWTSCMTHKGSEHSRGSRRFPLWNTEGRGRSAVLSWSHIGRTDRGRACTRLASLMWVSAESFLHPGSMADSTFLARRLNRLAQAGTGTRGDSVEPHTGNRASYTDHGTSRSRLAAFRRRGMTPAGRVHRGTCQSNPRTSHSPLGARTEGIEVGRPVWARGSRPSLERRGPRRGGFRRRRGHLHTAH